ncbi:MAG TPA: DNA repair protein RecO [Patescibacteria group bacterium]|jgi:DNA repair protein RecO (recombination protein O)|nr:DNA repair protein RecO [Patescibacteria group bacterium]
MPRSRERAIEAFIIKRQDFGETDQIITLFSKEEGKLRALVKAAKLPTSKLQPLLQPLFETRVSLSGHKDQAGLAKVIGVELIASYGKILEDQAKMAAWYVVAEILIRALPDNEPNEPLFFEFERFVTFLDASELTAEQVKQSVVQFQIKAMATLGLGIQSTSKTDQSLWFSLDRGGFVMEDSVDAIPIRPEIFQSFTILSQESYKAGVDLHPDIATALGNLINRFVTHQLEREIKSQRLLTNV